MYNFPALAAELNEVPRLEMFCKALCYLPGLVHPALLQIKLF